MSNVAIVYHSGYGHTQALAEAVAKGAEGVAGTKVSLIPVAEAEAREAELDAADAIIFGSPTYMGGVSADFAKFKDWTAKRWMEGQWRNKLAAGFTASASWNGKPLRVWASRSTSTGLVNLRTIARSSRSTMFNENTRPPAMSS